MLGVCFTQWRGNPYISWYFVVKKNMVYCRFSHEPIHCFFWFKSAMLYPGFPGWTLVSEVKNSKKAIEEGWSCYQSGCVFNWCVHAKIEFEDFFQEKKNCPSWINMDFGENCIYSHIVSGWWFQTFGLFFIIYGMSSFPLTNIFQDGFLTTNQV